MESALSPFLQTVFDKLLTPIFNELQSRAGYKKETRKLQELLPTIQAVITEAEERQVRDKRVQIWLRKLRHVAYDADDLFDELQTRTLTESKVFSWALPKISSNLSNYRKLKEVRERLDDIVKEMNSFGLRDIGVGVVYKRYETAEKRQTGPCLDDDSKVYGREKDAETIVEMLVSGNDSVIPIVAMGGMGKTTLAQMAYNDPRVERNFKLRIWISAYDAFNVRKLINDILDYTSNGATRHDKSQLGLLQTQLQDSLRGKRYLLVLDDVWNDDQAEWDKLRIPLRCGADGSKILVTTRSQSVASIMSATPPYLLQPLSRDDCGALFKQHAFEEGEDKLFPRLDSIGLEMVNTCGGVPLAAKILGSMMRSKREEREWLNVLKSSVEELGDSQISRALRLSYNDLPQHLKRCFSYLSVFPKKYEIEKEKLIRQWIALGLVPSWKNADEYFNDLMSRSFFQGVTKYDDVDDGMTKFKLHDLIHDLAVSVTGDEVLKITDNASYNDDTSYARYASTECNFHSTQNIKALFPGRKLRAIHLLPLSPEGADTGQKVIDQIISRQKRMRVLNLRGWGIESLHKSIGGLILLKYLDLSRTPIRTVPDAICDLLNLETLYLSGCNYLQELPSGISNLTNLRHLDIKDCTCLTHMPPHIGRLFKLQTLSIFIIGTTDEKSLYQLANLDLQGELKIKSLENIERLDPPGSYYFLAEKRLHSLGLSWGNEDEDCHSSSRQQLHSLGLSWGSENDAKFDGRSSLRQTAERNPGQNEEDVLAGLQPNRNLRRLSLRGYAGAMFPPWMNHGILLDLTKLDLINCRRCKNLPTLGQLPHLKVLNMKGIGYVVKIGGEFYGKFELNQPPFFQSLIKLKLEEFPNLRAWESMHGAVAFPCLSRLTIINCPRLSNMPRFPSLQHLELEECNAKILWSAMELNSLLTIVIHKFQELDIIPDALFENNSRLTSLTLISCPRITSLPTNLGNLTVLESLTIRFCEGLVTLPDGLRNLTSLQTLEIAQCGSLNSLPEKGFAGLISLRSFSIENCNNLTCLPIAMKHLKALEHLTIMYCPSLNHLPDGLQHSSMLQSLSIISCPELVSLPEGLQHVKMLQNLEIRGCGRLMELPEWVENFVSLRSLMISECQNLKSLPRGLLRLTALQHLSIVDCPDLEKRCQKETGEDWHKISRIPHRHIGSLSSQQIQGGASSSSI